jgi:hypothetical protein
LATEQFTNSAATTLNGGINNSTTSVVVQSATGFPTTGNFRILIDSEILLVTSVAGATFTVAARGTIEGTSAASHSNGAAVTEVLTAGSLSQHHQDRVQRGTFASRPAAGVTSRIYLCSDCPYISYDDGAAWNTYCMGMPVTEPPAVGSFSWINQGAATVTQLGSSGPITLTSITGNANSLNQQIVAAPATPYTITAAFAINLKPNGSNFPSGGIHFSDGTSKSSILQVQTPNLGAAGWYVTYWSSNTVAASNGYAGTGIVTGNLMWARVKDDGTNRIYYTSMDGQTFNQVFTEVRTNNFTATNVGFCVNASTDPSLVELTLYSWKQT